MGAKSKQLIAILGLLLFCSTTLIGKQGQRRFAEMDVFQLEYASDPQISPDGKRIVYIRNEMSIMEDRRRSKLWMVNADGSEHRKLSSGASNESSPRWAPDGNRVAFVSGTDEGSEIFLRWMDTGQMARLTQLPKSPRGLSWSPDGNWIAFSMLVPEDEPRLVKPPAKPKGAKWADHPRVITRVRHEADGSGYIEPGFNHLFVIPAEGGTPRQVTSGSFHHRGTPAWTPGSKSLLFSANRNPDWEYEFRNSEIYSVSLADGTIHALTTRKGPDHSPVVSPDGKWIAFLGYHDKIQTYQVTQLQVMKSDGSDHQVLATNLERSISSPVWDARGQGLYFRYDDRGISKIGYAPLRGDAKVLAENLGGTSLGRPYGGGSFSVSEDGTIAFTYTRPEHPADMAVWRQSQNKVDLITRLNKDLLSDRALSQVEEIWWKSSLDQRDIQGWIVTPPDFDANLQYPLLLEIHGGPISNYGERFSAEVQLYAAAGYVVLYANPRGSTGYGETFGNLLYHDYPGGDYDDLMSGVDAVIAKGYIDENSLFVTGGSAGGIMTAWIVGKTNRFRAAVVAKPVMN
ncbi:S9 family peptidase, partial [bacterium]|nr:S9 family peptidase [bacterium]